MIAAPLKQGRTSAGRRAPPDFGGLPNFVPTALTDHIAPIAGINPNSMTPDYRPTMVMAWNAGVQQRLGENGMVEIAYVATRGTHIYRGLNVNTTYWADGSSLDSRRPYYSISPLTQNITLAVSDGNSQYNSLQVKYSRRFAAGLQGLVTYTYGVSYDDTSILWVWDDRLNWAASSTIPRHIVNASWTYELPFGTGRHFLTAAARALDAVAGGWNVNGIALLRTGVPLQVGSKNNLLNTGTSNIANKTCSNLDYPKTVQQWFDTSCFADPTQPYTWGNATRGSVWGPGVVNFDLAVAKNFKFTESRSLEFRAEFFNALNNAHFSNPNTSMSSGNYGQITGTALPPREIQLGSKLLF